MTKAKCPKDNSYLINDAYVTMKRGARTAKLQSFKCPTCNSLYIFTSFLPNDTTHKIGEKYYRNFTSTKAERDRSAGKQQHSSVSESNTADRRIVIPQSSPDRIYTQNVVEKVLAYVSLGKRPDCINCGAKTAKTYSYVLTKKGKRRKLHYYKCAACDKNYVPIGPYNSDYKYYDIINKNELEAIKKEYKEVQAQKARENALKAKEEQEKKKSSIAQGNVKYDSHVANEQKYCLCELLDRSTYITKTVTVWEAEDRHLRKREELVSYKSAFGIACLQACADNKKILDFADRKYKVYRTVVYDPEFVSKYKSGNVFGNEVETNNQASSMKPVTLDQDSIKYPEPDLVYVYYKLQNRCLSEKHQLQSRTMSVEGITNSRRENVNVFYCQKCNKNFINYEAVQKMVDRRFFPCFKYKIITAENSRNPISPLKLYGYTVSEGVMTEKQRQELLSWIIERKLLSKAEIISLIQSFIGFNGKIERNYRAVEKWNADLKYLSTYQGAFNKPIHGKLVRPNGKW